MPDTYGLGHRPLVRKLSATQNDLFKKFDRSAPTSNDVGSSLSSSGTATPTGLTRSRPGSVKKVRTKAEVSQNTYRKFLYITSKVAQNQWIQSWPKTGPKWF